MMFSLSNWAGCHHLFCLIAEPILLSKSIIETLDATDCRFVGNALEIEISPVAESVAVYDCVFTKCGELTELEGEHDLKELMV